VVFLRSGPHFVVIAVAYYAEYPHIQPGAFFLNKSSYMSISYICSQKNKIEDEKEIAAGDHTVNYTLCVWNALDE